MYTFIETIDLMIKITDSLHFPESKPWVPSLEWEALAKHIPEIGNEWKKITSMFNK